MTYDDIVKAMECCSKGSVCECEKCPYSSLKADCFMLEQDAIELLKKQKKEIDKLNAEIAKLKKAKQE